MGSIFRLLSDYERHAGLALNPTKSKNRGQISRPALCVCDVAEQNVQVSCRVAIGQQPGQNAVNFELQIKRRRDVLI